MCAVVDCDIYFETDGVLKTSVYNEIKTT